MKRSKTTMLLLAALILALFAGGCGVGAGKQTQFDPDALRLQLQALPGAEVDATEPVVRYGVGVLYVEGAVLPLPGGLEMLDPLIELLQSQRQLVAEIEVRSAGHAPDYDRQLADKRGELLLRLLRNRGLPDERLRLTASADAGAPLEIRFQFR